MMNQEERITDNQIRFKTLMLRSSLCDYSEACIFVKGIIAVATETNAAPNNANKMAIFKNCVPLTNFMGRVDEASDINALMPMHNLVEYSHIQSKTSAILWQFHKDVSAANNDNEIVDLNAGNANARSFNLKVKLTYQTGNNAKKMLN